MSNFNLDEWLKTKKKGISGKIPREDFIAKIKELHELSQKLEKEKGELNKKLTGELESLKSDLTAREQTIQENKTSLKNKDKTIAEHEVSVKEIRQEKNQLEEQLKEKEGELAQLNQRPNITQEEYQKLVNNQEKHAEKDLKPANLPDDWEKQLSDKKIIEENFADAKEKLSTLEEDFLQVKAKLIEAEKRPTTEELEKAVQQEKDKYKDYEELKTSLNNLNNKITEYKEIISKLEAKIEKQDKTIGELKKELIIEAKQPPKDNSEDNSLILGEVKKLLDKELFNILKELSTNLFSLQEEVAQLKKNYKVSGQSSELPADYEEIKKVNKDLYAILKNVEENLPKE